MSKGKKKKQAARARKPEPRGMYLEVDVFTNKYDPDHEPDEPVRIESFQDIVRIGHRVAREVREYLRRVPMMPHVPSWHLSISASWQQTAAPRQVAEPAQRASDVEELEE